MKKIMSFILCFALLLGAFGISAFASDDGISAYLVNASNTYSNFNISDSGIASVYVSYHGFEGVMTYAKITITLQKRSFLLFWNDVTEWVDESYENYFATEHTCTVSNGTYRVKIQYEISGTSGETDIITEELKDSY